VRMAGGISGGVESLDSLSMEPAYGVNPRVSGSLSTPGFVGKANKKHAAALRGREAVTPKVMGMFRGWFCDLSRWRYLVLAAYLGLLVGLSFNEGRSFTVMSIIHINASAGVSVGLPTASLRVALHVTLRHNCAKARNRVRMAGGISGGVESLDSLSMEPAYGAYVCESRRNDTRMTPKNGH